VDIPEKTNKMMGMGSDVVEGKQIPQPTSLKAVSVILNEYFYPEANGYKAISVTAANRAEAEAIYLDKRVPVEPEKVEAKETNNE
jgi:hypothetical protein